MTSNDWEPLWLPSILSAMAQMKAANMQPRFLYAAPGIVRDLQREIGQVFSVEHSGHYLAGVAVIEDAAIPDDGTFLLREQARKEMH